MFEEFLKKIEEKKTEVGIIGLGYVGLPLAREFLKNGFKVKGFDIDEEKVKRLKRGESYIGYVKSDFIKRHLNKSFSVTSDLSKLSEPDILIVCVPTPVGKHNEPDLSFLKNTAETIARYMRKGQLIIIESTTYPGTTEEEILPILSKTSLKVGEDFFLGYSPEREDPGNKKFSTADIPKIVSGVTERCLLLVDRLYRKVVVKTVPVRSPKIAEAAKLLENIYRAVNIALVNELKIVFERMGIDIWEVIEAAKTKPFGFQPFYPGPGLGGHCIPIDPFYLTWKAKEYGVYTRFIELAGQINTSMPYYVVDKTIRALNERGIPVKGAKILIIGVAYKPDVDDDRESPAYVIMDLLEKEGAIVDYHDPYIPKTHPGRRYKKIKESVILKEDTVSSYDCIIIVTNHSNVDYEMLRKSSKLIIDTRNAMKTNGLKNENIIKA